ncbi:hypothetical protein ES707_05238 [subsurface metagenome]|jgi:hypothetical protein
MLQETQKETASFLITIAGKYKVSIEVLIRRLLRDLFELKNSVGIFRISREEAEANQIRIRRYYGEAIRSYMRKREKQVIEGVLEILQSNDPHKSLEDISSLYSDYVKIYKRESSSGLQSVVMLSFKRDALPCVADVCINVK